MHDEFAEEGWHPLDLVVEQKKRIAELEAENKRIREALTRLRGCVDDKTSDCVANDGKPFQSADLANAMANADRVLARAALSQEEKT